MPTGVRIVDVISERGNPGMLSTVTSISLTAPTVLVTLASNGRVALPLEAPPTVSSSAA